jgi:hypothetical protein
MRDPCHSGRYCYFSYENSKEFILLLGSLFSYITQRFIEESAMNERDVRKWCCFLIKKKCLVGI